MKNITCNKCGAEFKYEKNKIPSSCSYCSTAIDISGISSEELTANSYFYTANNAFQLGKYGQALQLVEYGLKLDRYHQKLIDLEVETKANLNEMRKNPSIENEASANEINRLAEADNYFMQANMILAELQANQQVYGSNSMLTGATPANVKLGIEYIDQSLEYYPNNGKYLNLKAILLGDGLGEKIEALKLLEKAATLDPRDINIQNNLKTYKSSGCFIATAAYGTEMFSEIDILRTWRDKTLLKGKWTKNLVKFYYRTSPPIAYFVSKHSSMRWVIRTALKPVILVLSLFYRNQ